MTPSPLIIIALCSNILGVFFLAKSITIKSPKYVLHDLMDFKVNKSSFFRAYIRQRLEAIIGFLFLFAGHALGIYFVLDALPAKAPPAWLVIALTVGAILLIAYVLGKVTKFFSGRIFVELVAFMVSMHKYPLESDDALVLELGKILKVRRDEEDTIESYTRKVLDRMKFDTEKVASERDRGRLAY